MDFKKKGNEHKMYSSTFRATYKHPNLTIEFHDGGTLKGKPGSKAKALDACKSAKGLSIGGAHVTLGEDKYDRE